MTRLQRHVSWICLLLGEGLIGRLDHYQPLKDKVGYMEVREKWDTGLLFPCVRYDGKPYGMSEIPDKIYLNILRFEELMTQGISLTVLYYT